MNKKGIWHFPSTYKIAIDILKSAVTLDLTPDIDALVKDKT